MQAAEAVVGDDDELVGGIGDVAQVVDLFVVVVCKDLVSTRIFLD